jgi:hypothetical protein
MQGGVGKGWRVQGAVKVQEPNQARRCWAFFICQSLNDSKSADRKRPASTARGLRWNAGSFPQEKTFRNLIQSLLGLGPSVYPSIYQSVSDAVLTSVRLVSEGVRDFRNRFARLIKFHNFCGINASAQSCAGL